MDIENPTQTAADLRAAADVIRERGWTQGDYVDTETGACCMVGAVDLATGYTDDGEQITGDADVRRRRDEAYFALSPHARPGPTVWNDAFGRTKDEVIEKLEQVATELEEQSA